MMNKQPRIFLALSGASGSVYAKVLLDYLEKSSINAKNIAWTASDNALEIWKAEIPEKSIQDYPFAYIAKNDFYSAYASGSAGADIMIIIPCSMGLIGRLANGVSDDLITRAADVTLKERRKLIIVPRESPYNLIHLRNMTLLTEAGAIICPASPSFYSKPATIEEIAATIVERVLQLAGIEGEYYRWGN